jgi:HTH-type transcriptional regulator, sugar sensing transcriptional regulator
MDTSILEDLGFTKSEIKIYLALLETGKGGASLLIDKTGLQNSVVHMTLNKLIKKGLVAYITKGRFREYFAQDPKIILEILDKKRSKLTELIPEIIKKQKPVEKNDAKVFKGLRGLKSALYDMIEEAKKGDEYLFFSFYTKNPNDFSEVYDYYKEFEKDREKYGIVTKGVAPQDIKEKFIGRSLKNIKFIDYPVPMNISVFRDNVLMTPWESEQITFLIKSRQLAESFRIYFYSIWNK